MRRWRRAGGGRLASTSDPGSQASSPPPEPTRSDRIGDASVSEPGRPGVVEPVRQLELPTEPAAGDARPATADGADPVEAERGTPAAAEGQVADAREGAMPQGGETPAGPEVPGEDETAHEVAAPRVPAPGVGREGQTTVDVAAARVPARDIGRADETTAEVAAPRVPASDVAREEQATAEVRAPGARAPDIGREDGVPGAVDLEEAEREAAAEAFVAMQGPATETAPSLEPVVPVAPGGASELSEAEIEAVTRLTIERLPARSPRAETCPFLRSVVAGTLQPPRDSVDGRNRCAAYGDPWPLSRMQQTLFCLQPSHADCPRYARGALLIQERLAPRPAPPRRLPVAAAALLLAMTALGVGTYTLLSGGLARTPTVSPAAIAPRAAATSAPTRTPRPAASVTPSPRRPARTTPPRRPTPAPLPAAYAGLERCPAPRNCYIYRVRRGDSLYAIARFFGTTGAVLLRLNPEIDDPTALRVAQPIRIPPP